MPTLSINGTVHHYDSLPSLPQILEFQGLTGRRIAVELNGEIVPRSRQDEVQLVSGDRLEIVVAVGGG
ncbi:MAG: sulfur carrier protein ThiS [Ferrovum sp.]|nr:sulfur carrier protein ThiS [Ferrovum sp.]NDU87549.1 sulfur carrier protein ThiS [Ferrovum sp.]